MSEFAVILAGLLLLVLRFVVRKARRPAARTPDTAAARRQMASLSGPEHWQEHTQ